MFKCAASIISRYLFINEFKKLVMSYNVSKKGAGPEVDKQGAEIIKNTVKNYLKLLSLVLRIPKK